MAKLKEPTLLDLVPKAQRKEAAKLMEKMLSGMIPAPPLEKSNFLKHKRLKLAWDDGREVVTDDYTNAASYLGLKSNTLIAYLSQALRKSSEGEFIDLEGNRVLISKFKPTHSARIFYLRKNVRLHGGGDDGYNGTYTAEEAIALLHVKSEAVLLKMCKDSKAGGIIKHNGPFEHVEIWEVPFEETDTAEDREKYLIANRCRGGRPKY